MRQPVNLLQSETAVIRALRQAFLQKDPAVGGELKIPRCVWSELEGRFFLSLRLFGRVYHRNLAPNERDKVAAIAEDVMREAQEALAHTTTRSH